ncbi:unnamed protein product [Dicrocoelium dendriticum]|nr:unnamed protein product [Dicrocoelium dendriticum]
MSQIISLHLSMLLELLGRPGTIRLLVTGGIGALVVRSAYRFHRRYRVRRRLEQKRAVLKERMNTFKAVLTQLQDSTDFSVTELDLSELRRRISAGILSPIDLLHAFQRKAMRLYDEGNSGICEFIQEAEELFNKTAAKNDPAPSSFTRPPLYGIPISVKETFRVKHYDSTGGLIKWCNMPSTEDCVLVQVLRDSGAIPFILTTTSQALRGIDGLNPVFGDCYNPYNTSRITGGSSCGEAVVLARRCSPIGIGTDIGGSIRIPAAFCGLASLKPTTNRLSPRGMLNSASNSVLGLFVSAGPMGHRVDDLADMMRALLIPSMFSLDPQVPPISFNETAFGGSDKKQLRIGFYDTLSHPRIIQTVPSVRAAVKVAVETLVKDGHQVVNFTPPDPDKAYRLYIRCLFADGGRQLQSHLADEPVGKQLRFLSLLMSIPNWLKFVSDIFAGMTSFGPISNVRTLGGLQRVQDVFHLLSAVREYKLQFERAWHEFGEPLDAVICPVSAYPAPPSSAPSLFITPSIIYTALYNLVDYPCGTVRTSVVDRVDVLESAKFAVDYRQKGNWYDSRVAVLQKDTEGLPLAVQVVGKPFCEELVLRVMRIIEAGLELDH